MSALTNVAFSDGFFEAQNKLPSNIQSKVNQTILKLMANSEQSGLNVEKLKVCKDDSFHSARVDQAYRTLCCCFGWIIMTMHISGH
jgi:hypothetical protein